MVNYSITPLYNLIHLLQKSLKNFSVLGQVVAESGQSAGGCLKPSCQEDYSLTSYLIRRNMRELSIESFLVQFIESVYKVSCCNSRLFSLILNSFGDIPQSFEC